MDKLKMMSKDKTQENFEILQKLFPNAVTETITGYDEDGKAIVERAIDKDVLQQVCPPRKNRQKTYAKNRMKRMTNII